MAVQELMQVTEEASATIHEDGFQAVPLFADDGITPLFNDDGSQVVEQRKAKIAIPIALHKGDLYPKGHEYVKKWPHLFRPAKATPGS